MSKKWYKGPPPSVGWWQASVMQNSRTLRWWNGRYWSVACYRSLPASEAAKQAKKPAYFIQSEIEWSPRPKSWPARSHT